MATTLNLHDYTRNDEDMRQYGAKLDLATDMAALDAFAAHATASFRTTFRVSGSAVAIGQNAGVIGSAIATQDRVILNVIGWAENSGSTGVTTVDIQKQFDALGGFASVFSGNNVYKLALSASNGNYAPVSVTSFVSGTNPVWQAGKLLRAQLATSVVEPAAASVAVIEVLWKPSGSYGV